MDVDGLGVDGMDVDRSVASSWHGWVESVLQNGTGPERWDNVSANACMRHDRARPPMT
jgi:hypothetical protein